MIFQSITHSTDFNKVYKNGVKVLTPFFVLYYLESEENELGVVAAKRQFSRAVDRNLCKRRIRAALRNVAEPAKKQKIVIVCRKKLLSTPFDELVSSLKLELCKL